MRAFTSLAVFTLFVFASVRCVDAGVMLSKTPAVIAETPSMHGSWESMAADWMAAQPDQDQGQGVWQSESSGMSGISVNTSPTVGQFAVVWEPELSVPQPLLSHWITLANAVLPPSPVFDGLLKPS
jgi:hypothetical protein